MQNKVYNRGLIIGWKHISSFRAKSKPMGLYIWGSRSFYRKDFSVWDIWGLIFGGGGNTRSFTARYGVVRATVAGVQLALAWQTCWVVAYGRYGWLNTPSLAWQTCWVVIKKRQAAMSLLENQTSRCSRFHAQCPSRHFIRRSDLFVMWI